MLGILTLALGVAAFSDTSDDVQPVPDPDPEDPVDPVAPAPEEPDVGVTIDINENTITIDVGEDETGSVVVIRTEEEIRIEGDPPETPIGGTTTNFGLRFFLLPEGMPFPPSVAEVIATLPAEDQQEIVEGPEADALPLDVYLENVGIEELGRVDLGSVTAENSVDRSVPRIISDTRVDDAEIVSNAELTAYEVNANLLSFRASGLDGTVAGMPLLEIDRDALVTPEVVETDGEATFDGAVISVTVPPDTAGQLVAIEFEREFLPGAACCSDGAAYSMLFYMLPEGVESLPSIVQTIEDAPLNSQIRQTATIDDDGAVSEQSFVFFDEYMEAIGAVLVGRTDLGQISFNDSNQDGVIVPDERADTRVTDFEIESNRAYLRYSVDVGLSETLRASTSFGDGTPFAAKPASERATAGTAVSDLS